MSLRDTLRRLLRPSSSNSDERPRDRNIPNPQSPPSVRFRSSSPSPQPRDLISAMDYLQQAEEHYRMVMEQESSAYYRMTTSGIERDVRRIIAGRELQRARRIIDNFSRGRGSMPRIRPVTNEVARIMEEIHQAVAGSDPAYTYTGDDAVAAIVADSAKASADRVKIDIDSTKASVSYEEAEAKKRQKRISTLKSKVTKLEQEYNNMTKKERDQFIEEYRQDITRLKRDERVERFEVDAARRIIVTTVPLMIKQDHWSRSRKAGQYQIRIDFSKSNASSAIRVLNITKRYNHYDSPTISANECCWGNLENDINEDLKTHNLYEIVSDMIAYITSPNDSDGYLSGDWGNNYGTGWEEWFAHARRMPEGFCWAIHDQNEAAKLVPGVNIDDNGDVLMNESLRIFDPVHVEVGSDMIQRYTEYNRNNWHVYNGSNLTETNPTTGYITVNNRQVELSPLQWQLMRDLENFGFVPTSAYRFAVMMCPNDNQRVLEFSLVRMNLSDDQVVPNTNNESNQLYQLYVRRQRRDIPVPSPSAPPETIEAYQRLMDEADRDRQVRFFVNPGDITSVLADQASHRWGISYNATESDNRMTQTGWSGLGTVTAGETGGGAGGGNLRLQRETEQALSTQMEELRRSLEMGMTIDPTSIMVEMQNQESEEDRPNRMRASRRVFATERQSTQQEVNVEDLF